MDVTQLDDDSLILIFKQFTTQELISLRAVCGRWQIIIEGICAGKQSLKLFSSPANVYQYCNDLMSLCQEEAEHLKLRNVPLDDDLVLSMEAPAVARILGSLFSTVSQLVVHLNGESAFNLPTLLQSLPALTRLSIFGEIPGDFVYQQQLCLAISSLAQLKHLELFKESEYSKILSPALNLQIPAVLCQLESFSLIGFDTDIVQILGQLGGDLKKLMLDRLPLHQLERLFQTPPAFARTLLNFTVDDLDEGSLAFICDNFPSLEALEIGLDDIKVTDIAKSLLKLPNLRQLKLKNFGIEQLDPQATESLPQLVNIVSLHIYKLNIFAQSLHGPNQLCRTLCVMFPSVEAIHLRNENPRHTPAVLAGIVRESLSPWEIGYLDRYKIYSTAELTHMGRHAEECKKEKVSRKMRMWDYDPAEQFDHNARLGRLTIGAAILQRAAGKAEDSAKGDES